ncbi:MAG TPA: SH3 domain-containing protein [Candidatus Binataceae bacterium]|nr:SH3 domain-containing protein [Candidatus Binataceae bacterium]
MMRRNIATVSGILVAALMFTTSAPMAWALSESPAAASSPAAGTAPPAAAPLPAAPPATKVVPSDETEGPAPSEAGAASAAPKKVVHHHHKASPPEVEPATARLRVTKEGWIYSEPSKSSKKLERATVGKFANVTGTTRYYLQVQLKNGETGYIPPSDVDLVKPTDKIFVLTQDAAVLDAPNHWAKKLAEVHRAHSVHVIGLALNYMQIRMKSGLIGFIPVTALQ